jgi:hypothetical protein
MSEELATTPPRAAALALKVATEGGANRNDPGAVPGQNAVSFRMALQGTEDLERRLAATRATVQAIAELLGAQRPGNGRPRPERPRNPSGPIFTQLASGMLAQAEIVAEIDGLLQNIKDVLR